MQAPASLRGMNWKDEPATENQLDHLRRFGYEPDSPLTKGEAAQLINDCEALPKEQRGPSAQSDNLELATHSAYRLRLEMETAKRGPAQISGPQIQNPRHTLELAIAERQEFWADTCSDADRVHLVSPQALALHRRHGFRFAVPALEQVQAILDALDPVMPYWDREHPELFYQTLELNFPDLIRHQQRR